MELKSKRCVSSPNSIANKSNVTVDLQDAAGPSRHAKHSVAELSRPNHKAKERIRMMKKYHRCMHIHEAHDAKYHNWFSPFLWTQIEWAVKHPAVGWKMSTWHLVKVLQKTNPHTFRKLNHNTVKAWIDWSTDPERPCWSQKMLSKVQAANFQGHNLGGQKGALVRASSIVLCCCV